MPEKDKRSDEFAARGMELQSELRHRGHKISVYSVPVPVDGTPRGGLRAAYVTIIDDSLNPDLDLEDVPRDTPDETIANAKELIDSQVDGEVDEVEDGPSN